MGDNFLVTIFGGGKVGVAIAHMLNSAGDYRVRLCDSEYNHVRTSISGLKNVSAHQLILSDAGSVAALLSGADAVISALPFHLSVPVAKAALNANIHFFGLTEDVAVSAEIAELARGAKKVFLPQCGLAPGFISIVAGTLIDKFEEPIAAKLRVGALSLFPTNRAKYNLSWSTEGLINQYCNPCEAIADGKIVTLLPLEGYERLTFDGVEYEAFNTSGGLGTLAKSYDGKIEYLDYKSIRYPGHCEYMRFLLEDLEFRKDKDALKNIMERSIPTTAQGKCMILVEVKGRRSGRLEQESFAAAVLSGPIGEYEFAAIQITTAAGVCAPMDLILKGQVTLAGGFGRCESIKMQDFIKSGFSKYMFE
jgi:saccharopine dehydrogenase-like NADP-dependent oxidoreductase